ncbi:Ig-like domain-containing protein [Bacillaceae bacterium S4-13-58]
MIKNRGIHFCLVIVLVFSLLPPSMFVSIQNVVAESNDIAPASWPADSEFIPYGSENGEVYKDPGADEHPVDVDITSGTARGVGNLPSLYVASVLNDSGGRIAVFRMRVKGDPYDRKGGFLSSVWLVQLKAAGEHTVTVGLNGKSPHTDYVYVANAGGTNVEMIYTTSAQLVNEKTVVPGTRIVEAENGQYFLDFQVPLEKLNHVLEEDEGVSGSTGLQLFYGTSKAANLSVINKETIDRQGQPQEISFDNLPSPPLTIDIDGGARVEASSNDITVSGTTSLDTGVVTVEINGKTKDVPINNNVWSLNLADENLIGSEIRSYILTATVSNNGDVAKDEQEIVVLGNDGNQLSINGGAKAQTYDTTPTLEGKMVSNQGNSSRVYVTIDNGNPGRAESSHTAETWNYTPSSTLSLGVHNIKVDLQDNQGNVLASVYQELTVLAADSGETTTPLSVAIGTITESGSATPSFTGTSSGAETVELQIDGITKEIVQPNSDGTWTVEELENPLSPEMHEITAIVRNNSGGFATDFATYTVFSTAITIDNGIEYTTNDTQPTIKGSTNAVDGTLVTVTIEDSSSNQVFSGDVPVSGGRWMAEVTQEEALQGGEYDVTATVPTINGASVSAYQKLTIVTGTDIEITTPTDNQTYNDATVPFLGSADESSTIDLYLKNQGDADTAYQYVKSITADSVGWTTTSTSLSNGLYTLKAVTADLYGNTATDTVNFEVSVAAENPSPSSDKELVSTGIGNLDGNPATGIKNVPTGSKVSTFKQGLTVSENATVEILTDSNGAAVTDQENTDLTEDMVIQVTAEDGTTAQYTIILAATTLPVIGGTVTIETNPVFGDTLTANINGIIYTPDTSDDVPTYQWFRDDQPISGETHSTYTVGSDDIGKSITVKVSADGEHATGSVTSNSSNPVQKLAGPNAPDAPVVQSKTATSITVSVVSGQEYRIGDGPWQDSGEFTGLNPETEYEIFTRIKATTTTEASGTSPGTKATTDATTLPVLGGEVTITGDPTFGKTLTADLSKITYTPNTNEDKPLYQWKRDGAEIEGATGTTYILKENDIGAKITFTITADDVHATGSVTSDPTISIEKAAGPEAPAAPTYKSKTSTSITVEVVTGQEYSLGDGTWQDSGTFTGLNPGTEYDVITRIKETATQKASNPSNATTIKTLLELDGTLGITGYPVIEEVLAADISGITYKPSPQTDDSSHLIYQWYRDGQEIDGETSSTYTATGVDFEKNISVKVTADDEHATGSVESDPVVIKNDEQAVDDALKNLKIEYENDKDTWESVTSNAILIQTEGYGTDIEWTSSKPNVVSIPEDEKNSYNVTTTVTRQSTEEVVILTAVVSKGSISKKRTFLLIIKADGLTKSTQENVRTINAIAANGNTAVPINRVDVRDSINNRDVKIDKAIVKLSHVNDILNNLSANHSVTIYVDELPTDVPDEIAVEVKADAVAAFASHFVNLDIKTEYTSFALDSNALHEMAASGLDLFFRVVPIKDPVQKNTIKNGVANEPAVTQVESATGKQANLLGNPIQIHTNYSNYETTLYIPFAKNDIQYEDINNLRVFIEHSDGEKVVREDLTPYFDANGNPIGVSFPINKFSTFTLFELKGGSSPPSGGNTGGSTPPDEGSTDGGNSGGSGTDTPTQPDDNNPTDPDQNSEPDSNDGTEGNSNPDSNGNTENPTDNSTGETNDSENDQDSNQQEPENNLDGDATLPNTANNYYNYMAIGALSILLGILLSLIIQITRRKPKYK